MNTSGSGLVSDEQEKTHVLTTDCIITEIGRCEAGEMLSEQDVLPSTWTWLQDRNFLKSVEEIEQEADGTEPEGEDSEEPSVQPEPSTAGADEAPETKPATGRRRK